MELYVMVCIYLSIFLAFIIYFAVLHNSQSQPISLMQLTDWAMQLAVGLAFIHCHQIAHRDLKPAK